MEMCINISLNQGIDALIALGTLVAAIFAAKSAKYSKEALEAGNMPIISFITAEIGGKDNDGYRINIFLKNVGSGPANIMVVDAVGNSFKKVHIGVPNIIDKSGQSNISIWLNNQEESTNVAIAVYY